MITKKHIEYWRELVKEPLFLDILNDLEADLLDSQSRYDELPHQQSESLGAMRGVRSFKKALLSPDPLPDPEIADENSLSYDTELQ